MDGVISRCGHLQVAEVLPRLGESREKLPCTLELLSLAHARSIAEFSRTLVVIGHGMAKKGERGLFTYLAKMWERGG